MKIPNKKEFQQIVLSRWSGIEFKDFIKLYKDYTKEKLSLLVNFKTSDDPFRFRKNLLDSVSEKINKTDKKIEEKKAQYDLDRQTDS